MISTIIGSIETKTMPSVTSEKLFLMIGIVAERVAGAEAEAHPGRARR